MFFIKLIRFFLGYVTFTASGGFSERFINLCSQKHIALWDVESRGGVIYACTNINGYKNIKECARRSSMKVRIYKKHGIPFFMFKYRARVGFLIGAVVFLIIIGLLSTRLWTVEVKGNDKVPDKVILKVFEDLGIDTGARISKIDVKKTQEQALEQLDDLSWLALNISGSTATIEVRESIKKPQILEQKPCNIVASHGGQIIKLEVYEGVTEQLIGAAVAKGDLLVSGVVVNKDNSSSLRHARGLVVAKTDRNLSNIQNSKTVKKVLVDERTRYRVLFFGLDLPLSWLSNKRDNSQYYRHEYKMKIAGSILPVGYVKEGYRKYEEKELSLGKHECMLMCFEGYSQLQHLKFDKIKIISEKVEMAENNDSVSMAGVYSCEENIGINQEIYLEN